VVKIKNTLTSSIDVTVIREVTTTLASGEEQEIAVGSDERVEIKPST